MHFTKKQNNFHAYDGYEYVNLTEWLTGTFWLTDQDARTKLLIPAKTGHMVNGAARNFIREGSVTCCLTDCSFRTFRTVEINMKHQWKILASLFWGAWPLRPHSGCATAYGMPTDSQSRRLCIGSDKQFPSKVLILKKKEPRRMCIWWGMRPRTLKISMNKWSCYLVKCH